MLRLTTSLSKRILRPPNSVMVRNSSAAVCPLAQGYAIDPAETPMFRYQASLPKLPVPTLESTCEKYLETVQPLLTPDEYAKTQSSVSSFLASPLAAELQSRLKDRAAQPGTLNWLSDWWNDVAYMGYRDPVVVYVSYFYVHHDDPSRKDPAARAASLIKAMLVFRELVESGRLEPEKVRGAPLCMNSYKWLFHSSRYPVKPSDTAQKFDPATNNHIIVIRKSRFFLVPVADITGREYSAAEIEIQLQNIIAHAGSEASPTPVGALTSDNRDLWTDAREALLAASPSGKNAELLRKIEGAMIILALDDTKPVSRRNISRSTWVGDGRNRWFDKHQLIVYENGRSGFLGEHSCMDGTPTLRMNEFVLASISSGKVDLNLTRTSASKLPEVEELVFELDDKVQKAIKDAEARFDELVGKHELNVLNYNRFGKNFIKKRKISPDAVVQLIKQLAFHRMFGRQAVTYESAQTRKYQLGRTEVIRSLSKESKAWVEAMVDPEPQDPIHLFSLFTTAANRHTRYATWAADGQGVDRHLFGLKKMLKEGEPLPEIYTDPAFGRSSHWELSTSQLSSQYLDGWGYGEVVPDGYGLSYSIGDEYLRWTITSLKKNTAELKAHLARAASDVRDMIQAGRRRRPKL